ncbi:MAG TPA: hypothetical protein VF317_02590 [Dermatophilaceae bacterium]
MSGTQPTPSAKRDVPETPAAVATPDNLASSTAPMPTAHTVRMRTNLPLQVVRFGIVNLRMLRMVLKSHK